MTTADAGAQAERTRLAWRRTALAATVVGILAVRMALHTGLTPLRAAGLVGGVAFWIFGLVVAQLRIWALAGRTPVAMARTAALTVAACVGTAGIAAILVVADLF
ncbi:MAG: DUF202 domain-containing protein [Hamadaea sp.]|nr:DUF202 domain-containing protein [Hamadaea sp.]